MKDKHHRVPSSKGGSDDPSNISVVPQTLHRAFHMLFSNDDPREVARKLTAIWCDPEMYFVAFPRKRRKPIVIQEGSIRIVVQVYDRGSRKWAKACARLRVKP